MFTYVFFASSDCSWIEIAVNFVFSKLVINSLFYKIVEGSASESYFSNDDYKSSNKT